MVAAWCEEIDARGVRLKGRVLGPLAETWTIQFGDGARGVLPSGTRPSALDEVVAAVEVNLGGTCVSRCDVMLDRVEDRDDVHRLDRDSDAPATVVADDFGVES
jgi:hypothetical protein